MQVQFKVINGVSFYSTNGRSWIERMGDYKAEFAQWLAQQSA